MSVNDTNSQPRNCEWLQTTVVSNRYKVATKTQHDQKETLNDYRHKKETK